MIQFVIDEAASLGQFQPLNDALDKYRGYGVRLLLIYQSTGQLKNCWPDGQDQNLLANTTQVFFGVNDYATADYVSNRLGEETISVESGGTNRGESRQANDADAGRSYGTSWGRNDNWNQSGRKLLKPEEVLALDPRIAIVFTPGLRPIWARLIRYYEARAPTRWKFKAFVSSVFFFLVALIVAAMVWR